MTTMPPPGSSFEDPRWLVDGDETVWSETMYYALEVGPKMFFPRDSHGNGNEL